MIEPLNSIESGAKTLGISPWTARARIRRGDIRVVRIGRRVLIPSEELRRIIEHGLPSQKAEKGGDK
jgi:excisionase family DNA binding protein